MDEEINNLLTTWGLEAYIDIFAKNKISVEILGLLDAPLIKELFPIIGDRAIFTKNLDNYKKISQSDQAIEMTDFNENISDDISEITDFSKVSDTDYGDILSTNVDMLSQKHRDPFADISIMNNVQAASDSQMSLLSSASSPIPSFSKAESSAAQQSFLLLTTKDLVVNQNKKKLLEMLESSVDGRAILSLHREEGLLSSCSRRKICNIIIKELLGDDPKTTTILSSTLYDMAVQIKQIFNKENISTYFIPYVNNKKLKIRRCAKGKLYDCLHNRKREYRLAENKVIEKSGTDSSSKEDTTNMVVVETVDVSEDIAWIKVSTEPWKILEEKWKNTSKYRQEEAEKMSITEYMALYPGLKKPTGYHLLCIDFDNLYPEATDNLYKNFMLSKKAILELASTKFKSNTGMNETIKTMLDNLTEIQQQDSRKAEEVENITAFLILPLLLGPPLVKKKKTSWRPSKQECRDDFLAHVIRPMDLQETITKRKDKYLLYGATLQPSIFIVGENLHNINQYFVLVDNIFYTVNNIMQAVDVCFKIFQALHCEYPLACETVWHFIQKGFYKINTSYDKEFVSVNSLLADLLLVEI